MDKAPEFYAKDRKAWRRWLQANHDKQRAVWLVFDKGKQRTLAWTDIVQEELCFGWIDSKQMSISDTQSKIYVCQRRPKSNWSKINKQHALAMIEAGLMTSAGQAAIDAAKQNGKWDVVD